MIAQFYCELADRSRQHGARVRKPATTCGRPSTCQADCVRAFMLTGRLYAEEGQHAEAVKVYEQAVEADIAFVPEILPPLAQQLRPLAADGARRAFPAATSSSVITASRRCSR